jgi:fatty acid desaturase
MESKMDKFLVKPDSWHYKLVEEHVTDKYPYDLREKAMPKDFCSYWRRVVIESLKTGMMVALFVAAIAFLLSCIGYVFYALIFDFSGAGSAILIVIALFASILFFVELPDIIRYRRINKLKQTDSEKTTTNIFVQRYKSWKGKFCPSIEYEREI